MVVKIDNYSFGKKVVSLALDKNTAIKLNNYNSPYMYLNQNTLFFIPEMISLPISDDCKYRLSHCDNFDVFIINNNGLAYQFYNNKSEDNVIFMTPHCNSNCIMCPTSDYIRKKKVYDSINETLQAVRIMPTDVKHITITGGEPFLSGDGLFGVLRILKERMPNTAFLLLTNGRALSDQQIMEKYHHNSPHQLLTGIPLHGSNADKHDYITRSPGGFKQTIKGISNLLRYGHSVEIRLVVCKLNIDDVISIAKLIVDYFPEVSTVKIMGVEMTGNAARNRESIWISYRDAFLASKGAIDVLIQASIDVALYNFPLCSVDPSYYHICKKSITDYKIRYKEECDACSVKDSCGGVFAGSFRLASSDIRPVI